MAEGAGFMAEGAGFTAEGCISADGHFGGEHFGMQHFGGAQHFGGFGHSRFAFHRSFGGARASRHAATGYAAGRPFGPPVRAQVAGANRVGLTLSARKSRAPSRVGPTRRTQWARTVKPEPFDTGNSGGGIFIAAT